MYKCVGQWGSGVPSACAENDHSNGFPPPLFKNVVVVIPFAVVEELDWQKDVSGNQAKNRIARKASNFINKHLASGSSFIVVQTLEEDKVRGGRSDAWP